jgi:CBS domain containing-hemolysin-like protein
LLFDTHPVLASLTLLPAELKELVGLHGITSLDNADPLTADEVMIIQSALEMKNKHVGDEDIYKPLDRVFMLSRDTPIDRELMRTVSFVRHFCARC